MLDPEKARQALARDLFIIGAVHRHELQIDLLFQQIHPTIEERFQIGHLQMLVEILPRPPVFIEEEQVRVGVADMEMIFDATSLGAGWLDEPAQHGEQFVSLLRLALEKCDQRASRIHADVLPALIGRLIARPTEASIGLTSHAPARLRTVE